MSTLDLMPNDLLVCIDETGDASLRDPNHPIFGFGGCAITGADCRTAFDEPWKELKRAHFGSVHAPLHATSIDPGDKDAIQAIGRFFEGAPIARFATVLSRRTVIAGDSTDPYEALAHSFVDQLGRLFRHYQFHRLVLAFESSEAGNQQVERRFGKVRPILLGPDGPFRGPVERCFIPKSAAVAAMEVADFIVQAAGGEERRRLNRKERRRRDFQAIFAPAAGRFADISFLSSVRLRKVLHATTRHS
jgi:hypothetical protein